MKKIQAYIKLIRSYQWFKNLFIFLPMLFAFKLNDPSLYVQCGLAFIGLSFIASSIYIINDWCDIEEDKLHPLKKDRPLAAGIVSKTEAMILVAVLLYIGFSIYIFLLPGKLAAILAAIYFIMNLFYSFKLKNIPILDIAIIAIGFVLRILIGGVVTGIHLSEWIIIMTFLLALLLAIGKRRDDVLLLERIGEKARKNIGGYNLTFIDTSTVIMAAIIIVAYIMYTISPKVVQQNREYLYFSALFVILGILRYLQILFVYEGGGNPTKIFIKDRALHLIMLGWTISFFTISFAHRLGHF